MDKTIVEIIVTTITATTKAIIIITTIQDNNNKCYGNNVSNRIITKEKYNKRNK